MAMTSKATWIWYPGDYEIWLGNKMNNRNLLHFSRKYFHCNHDTYIAYPNR